jgi:hypothetical protein
MELRNYALANGYAYSFKPHHEVAIAFDFSLNSKPEKDRYERFLEQANAILKCGKLEYYDGYMLTEKKTSKAVRERFWWFCAGLSYSDYFME